MGRLESVSSQGAGTFQHETAKAESGIDSLDTPYVTEKNHKMGQLSKSTRSTKNLRVKELLQMNQTKVISSRNQELDRDR